MKNITLTVRAHIDIPYRVWYKNRTQIRIVPIGPRIIDSMYYDWMENIRRIMYRS